MAPPVSSEIPVPVNASAPASAEGCTGYLAPQGFIADLQHELGDSVVGVYDHLVLAKNTSMTPVWVANTWLEPMIMPIESIGDAAKKLRAIQRNWALYPFSSHRRAALIHDKLPKVSAKPVVFGTESPAAPLGSWTLLDASTLLASPRCSSPFPNGELDFIENHCDAPSRAYLKLWDLFTLIKERPAAGEFCLDLGACPGGWTWVLQQIGARVLSVDKAPLDERVSSLPNVEFRSDSAFALDPLSVGPVDWLFSDVICYPKRLLTMINKWMKAGTVKHFVCTIKFQGPTDFEAIQEFASIPGSRILHLPHNKHELTWIKL
jgi:23S rRNA (cytidine2498-2'-O)-methyltransferase